MSHTQPRDALPEGDPETMTSGQHENALKRVFNNNKGVFLILLAQVAGSSMDAIARFLQLSGGGMHPFQVRCSQLS
jgi:hypothetical protein